MIDIKNEMAKKVDHPVPYLVDLVGRLVKERDFLLDLCVQQSIRFAGEFDCINLGEGQAKRWVIEQLDTLDKPQEEETWLTKQSIHTR